MRRTGLTIISGTVGEVLLKWFLFFLTIHKGFILKQNRWWIHQSSLSQRAKLFSLSGINMFSRKNQPFKQFFFRVFRTAEWDNLFQMMGDIHSWKLGRVSPLKSITFHGFEAIYEHPSECTKSFGEARVAKRYPKLVFLIGHQLIDLSIYRANN